MSKNQNIEQLQLLLRQGPSKATALVKSLAISQPTFSRLWTATRGGVVLGAGKARQYALRRQVQGVDAPIPVFCVTAAGHIAPMGQLDLLQGGFYAMTPLEGTHHDVYQGMPFFISDVGPQGFLGRMEPGRNRELELPADIWRWTTEQVLKYISRRSEHAAGDLILGNESYGRYLESAAA